MLKPRRIIAFWIVRRIWGGVATSLGTEDGGMSPRRQWDALFEAHFEQVYAYVACRVWPNGEAAKDIAQEVFLAAWKKRREFRRESSALSWLRGIARHKVADHFRVRSKGTEEIDTDEIAVGLDVGGEGQRRAIAVAGALKLLPEHYARLLEEKYLEGDSVQTMAQRSGVSEKAVESALVRAREAFRQVYPRAEREMDRQECSDGNR